MESEIRGESVRKSAILLWIVASGSLIIGIISLSVVGAVIYTSVNYNRVPEILANWGGLIIGFFLGNFFNLLRTALGVKFEDADREEKSK